MDNEFINYNHLTSLHSDHNSCLINACRFNSKCVKIIFESDKFNKRILTYHDNFNNFLQVASRFQPDAYKYIINLEMDLSYFMYNYQSDTDYFFNSIVQYYPDLVKFTLDSKYGSKKLLLRSFVENTNCVEIAFESQPKSLIPIIESKCFDKGLFKVSINKIIKDLSKNFDFVKSINDLKKINVFDIENKHVDENSDFVCIICYSHAYNTNT